MGRGIAPVSVLVVEGEVLISNLVADALGASGFLVHEVTTADEALEYIDSGAPSTSCSLTHQSAGRHERRGAGDKCA